MTCCKSKDFPWCNDLPTITAPDGNEYCIFHAPVGCPHKVDGDFNKEALNRIYGSYPDNCCNMSGSIFPADIQLNTNLDNELDLTSAEFHGKVRFTNCTFNKSLSLINCDFFESVLIRNVIFEQEVQFDSSRFYKKYQISDSSFKGDFHLYGAICKDSVLFSNNIFSGQSIFEDASFEDDVEFVGKKFKKETNFENTKFYKKFTFRDFALYNQCKFNNAVFTGWASFYNLDFYDSAHADFFDIEAGSSGREQIVLFEYVDIGKIVFSALEMEKIKFNCCVWPNVLYQEKNELFELYELEELYRALKIRASEDKDQKLVSRWNYLEKLTILNKIKLDKPYSYFFTVTWIYWISSGFGERPIKSFFFLLGLLFVLLLASVSIYEPRTGLHPALSQSDWDSIFISWLNCFPLSKSMFIKQEIGAFKLTFYWIGQILITIQSALFAFALRNKFRR